jgi:hypothetical protein
VLADNRPFGGADDVLEMDALAFVEDLAHWGYKFRFGLFRISDAEMRLGKHCCLSNSCSF